MTDIINEFISSKPYWNNTELLLNVEDSLIPVAGKGIFTYEKIIKKGQHIGYYEGKLKKEGRECVGDYSFTLSNVWYLDARNFPRAYTAMINDSHNSKFNTNYEFVMVMHDDNGKKLSPKDRKIALQATRNIYFGEELFASYGEDYWTCESRINI